MNETSLPGISIIIPTYQEAKNLPSLITAISQVNFSLRPFEVLLMDDNSQDATQEIVSHLITTHPWLTLIVRRKERSLSQSIIDGIAAARYPIIVTMDADLSHPPEKIPEMAAILDDPSIDLVIGSRYIPGGSTDEQWPLIRKLTSQFAAFLARKYLCANAKDPLSGFIAIRKTTIQSGQPLKPIGWKVGLEMIVKCRCNTIREIPIHFAQRREGKSKLNFKISLDYLRHLIALKQFRA